MKTSFYKLISIALLLVASAGVQPACWLHWYQPQLPE
ncbi:MAG: cyclic lactone autoinducer peptide [Syntrophomonadaceae bacterium]